MRRLARGLFATVVALALPASAAHAATAGGSEDALARTYFGLLEKNTPFQESTWDAQTGTYPDRDFYFSGTLGNAVLLKLGSYDADATGVPRQQLQDHTVASIAYAAAHNKFVDPSGDWGAHVYWDAAFEAYLAAAAHLMWDDLDDQTRRNIDKIVHDEADYMVSAGANPTDPSREGGSTNGLKGGYVGDTKQEEMGNRTMILAAALAYLPDDPHAADWRRWLDLFTSNMNGLPVADAANPTLIDGTPISTWNTAQNIFDTFIVENHGAWNPIYQQSAGAYPGRNAAQFLIAGRPVPELMSKVANDDALWDTMGQLGMDAGVPEDFMVADRHHLYGRNLLPITYRSMVLGDRYALRAEQMLADHFGPYVDYPPQGRLTKFSGEPKYEPEARAELGMAYVLHYWRDRLAGDVEPASAQEYFRHFAWSRDYGSTVGLTAQQTPGALSAAVTKPGYVKFAFLPQHDDWLFDVAGSSPSLLPSVAAVDARSTQVYRGPRDGFEGTATVVRRGGAYAGFTTLPNGSVVYATTGTGSQEGRLNLYNLDMPGVPGLDGDRTFTASDGSATLSGDQGGLGDGGVDDVHLTSTSARYVRFLGVQPATQFGYSLFDFEVHDGAGPDLARGKTTTASSFDAVAPPGPFPPQAATDGSSSTRWAVARSERTRPDSWLEVDLGSQQSFDDVLLRFETAYGRAYRIQVSDDGSTWRDAATVPTSRTFHGSWLNVDGRAGFVIRNSQNPIGVTPTSVTLSDGPASGAAGMIVAGFPAQTPAETAREATARQPAGGPDALRSALTGGYLSLLNLGAADVGADLSLPAGDATTLYDGEQETTAGGTTYRVTLAGGTAAVRAPRFELRPRAGTPSVPAGLNVDVVDSHRVRVENAGSDSVAQLTLTSVATGERAEVTVAPGKTADATFQAGLLTPVSDLARAQITYPSSPLPPGMTSPDRAVDGDPATAWVPGAAGRRMVVNLGGERALGEVALQWRDGRVPRYAVEVSDDGVAWTRAAEHVGAGPTTQRFRLDRSARYVSVLVEDWAPGAAGLAELSARG